ncbi:MAG: hypothetical protein JXB36_19780 [Gammaproteobacteria bacterium]|nr:hypothetical protein [Gammaproteobacteria bacterium]
MNQQALAQILIVTASAGLAACSGPEGAAEAEAGGGAATAAAQEPQTSFTYPDGSPHPVTPWGDPDLQGMWPIMHLFSTRLQRDPKYGDRRFLNDEEWAEAQAVLQRREERYRNEIDSNKMGMGHWAETTTRVEAARLTSLISYPPDGQIPALTARGEELVPQFRSDDTHDVFDSPADFDAWDRCITRGLPSSMLPFNYNNGIQIIQSPGYVVINLEMIHEARIVPVDDRPPLDSDIKQWLGESRGYWDGATLVVETTNFNGKVGMTNVGIPGSPRRDTPTTTGMKVTERFTRVADDQIDYEMTIEDPEVMTDKWTVSYPMFLDPEYEFFEYACHEGNTAVRNFIETSRYERGLTPSGQPRE